MAVSVGRVKTYRQWEFKVTWRSLVLRLEVHGYWQGAGLVVDPWVSLGERAGGLHVSVYTLFGGLSVDAYLEGTPSESPACVPPRGQGAKS